MNTILDLYKEFGYDSEDFVKKIVDGKTCNHIESIHCLLFRMIKKTEAIGMDIMKFGSALAVIRYNEGFHGIQSLFHVLQIEVTDDMKMFFDRLDSNQVSKSRLIKSEAKKRYDKKQR